MSSELVSCPECKRKLRVPTDLVGKLVKCPTCGQTFTADPAAHAPPPPPAAADEKVARTSKVSRDDEEDEDEERSHRQRSRSRKDDDDDDDRPRRRSRSRRDDDDEDDDDDRPRRRSRDRRDLAPHRGGAVLAIGILSFFFFPIILGPIAWIMGNTDLAQMRAGRMDPEGEGSTSAGRICGMISTILGALGLILFFGFCVCAGMGGGGGGPVGGRRF